MNGLSGWSKTARIVAELVDRQDAIAAITAATDLLAQLKQCR
jgi:hypothetical protein